jgi:large subunit ribosomal protein L20
MPRVKRGPHRKEKRRRTLKLAKGFYGKKKNAYRIAKQAVERALKFSYRDRRTKKREFRRLWIVRINAASRENGLSYNRLISGLRKAGLELDRKVLADIAVHDAEGFAAVVEVAKDALTEGAEAAGVKVRPETEKSQRPERRERRVGEAKPRKRKPEGEGEAEKPAPKKKPAAKKAPAKKAAPPKQEKEKKAAEAKPPKAAAPPKEAAPKKEAAKPAAAPAEAPSKKDLEAMTVPELQELAAAHGIAEGDIEGSGASGNVVKADWVRVAGGLESLTVPELEKLAEKRGVSKDDVEGSGASGNVVKADWVRALSEK